MDSLDVLYVIEHEARELDLACLISYLLQRDHNVSVCIGSIAPESLASFKHLEPKLVVVPYFYTNADRGVRDLVAMFPDTPFVNLAFEQVLLEANKTLKAPRDIMVQQYVMHLAVGDFFRDYLVDHDVQAEHVRVVGSLGVGLNSEPYRRAYQQRRDALAATYDLEPSKRWLFFPENLGAAFWTPRQIEQRVEQGVPANQVHGYHAYAKRCLAAVMPWMWEVARRGHIQVIVRPRPSTARNDFLRAAERAAGPAPSSLRLLKDGTIREWQFASDVVVSTYSTSLIDAAVGGKPAYMLAPEPFPDYLHADWYDHLPHLTDMDTFIQTVEAPPDPTDSNPLRNWAQAHLLANGDPVANVVEILSDLVRNPDKAPPPPSTSPDYSPPRPHQPYRTMLRQLRQRILGRPAEQVQPTLSEETPVTSAQVQAGVEKWANVLHSVPGAHLLR